jgi:hypothetical protein
VPNSVNINLFPRTATCPTHLLSYLITLIIFVLHYRLHFWTCVGISKSIQTTFVILTTVNLLQCSTNYFCPSSKQASLSIDLHPSLKQRNHSKSEHGLSNPLRKPF